jgi:ferredoxin-type protein NapH
LTPAPRYGRWRRAAQVSVAAFYLTLPFTGAKAVAGTLAALQLGPVDLVEPAAALSAAVAARGQVGWALLVGAAPVVLLAVVLGPVFCSWACPFGLVSEGIQRLRWGGQRWKGRPWVTVRGARLASLGSFIAASAALGLPAAALLSPPRLVTALPLEARAAGAIPLVTAGLLLALLALEVLGPRRILCRALCPAGALANFLRTRRSVQPRFCPERCACAPEAPCLQACPWGIDPREMRLHDGCTTCLACVERCPSGALALGRARDAPAAASRPRSTFNRTPEAARGAEEE